jgi:hypothetical protein
VRQRGACQQENQPEGTEGADHGQALRLWDRASLGFQYDSRVVMGACQAQAFSRRVQTWR